MAWRRRLGSPRTNGSVELMNRTLLDEYFRVAGRTTWYLEVEEIHPDFDRVLACYNVDRTQQSYRLKGRTPAQALCEALGLDELPRFPQPSNENTLEARKEGEAA